MSLKDLEVRFNSTICINSYTYEIPMTTVISDRVRNIRIIEEIVDDRGWKKFNRKF